MVLRRQYQTEKVLVGVINSGMHQASFMKDAGYGVRGGLDTLQRQEGHVELNLKSFREGCLV